MELHVYNSDTLFVTPKVLGQFDAVVIGQNGLVYGQQSLFTGATGVDIMVAGIAASWLTAISFGTSVAERGASVQVTRTGAIQGYQALAYNGTNLFFHNDGAVLCDTTALYLRGASEPGSQSRVVNTGSLLSGGVAAIFGDMTLTESYVIRNSGVIGNTGSGDAIQFSDVAAANDRVINSGTMLGDVRLGGGNDLYDARSGGVVEGTIAGGVGDDRFRPGLAEEIFAGEGGTDTLDFRGGGAVIIALDNAFDAGGRAEGDSWSGIENLIGSRGEDRLAGDGAANRLTGGGGADVISGGAGNDTIEGGEGIDILTGGSGHDAFLIRRAAEGGDVITDFSALAPGNDDRIALALSGFDLSLPAGAVAATRFRARADNLAQDADDRFIFRTSDTTLWFDADGNGSGGAILVADLQAGAVLTAADIVMF